MPMMETGNPLAIDFLYGDSSLGAVSICFAVDHDPISIRLTEATI